MFFQKRNSFSSVPDKSLVNASTEEKGENTVLRFIHITRKLELEIRRTWKMFEIMKAKCSSKI